MEGVELRTEHKHGVELSLSSAQRADVKRVFADSPITLAGLGSTYEFHNPDPAVVKQNIEGAIAYCRLAAEVGASGIKVRPNGIPEGVPPEKTCEQIGTALRQVGTFGADLGVQVRLEVHGKDSSNPKFIRMMMDAANHPNALVCWNSNGSDMDDKGSIEASFNVLKDKIAHCHITEIGVSQYPWQDLFDRLKGIHYAGWCLAEIAYNPEPNRFMKYYRTLFDLYTGGYRWPGT
jgi:sugar phosphate isomerase/epimerase